MFLRTHPKSASIWCIMEEGLDPKQEAFHGPFCSRYFGGDLVRFIPFTINGIIQVKLWIFIQVKVWIFFFISRRNLTCKTNLGFRTKGVYCPCCLLMLLDLFHVREAIYWKPAQIPVHILILAPKAFWQAIYWKLARSGEGN